jgi:hypothetical protein
VRYRSNLSRRQRITVTAMGGLHMALAAALVIFLLLPDNLPVLSENPVVALVGVAGLLMLVGLQVIAGLRSWSLTYHTMVARDPVPMVAEPGLRVAVLTTIVPGKEPVELVMATLRAMKRIRHDGVLDVWLLDEGNDPEVQRLCAEIGAKHFSRKGRPEWNTDSGPYRRKTKHGNHNSWRAEHEMDYDVVAQMDPDHVPYPHFLERTLGYFADPDTAFVVAPQVYGNLGESFASTSLVVVERRESNAVRHAATASASVSMRQSTCRASSTWSNHTTPAISGLCCSSAKVSASHCALLPPLLLLPVSAIQMGLAVSDCSAAMVGSNSESNVLHSVAKWPRRWSPQL